MIEKMSDTCLIKNIHIFQEYLSQPKTLVVAVSGGVDSTSLVLLLQRLSNVKNKPVWVHAKTPAVPKKHTEQLKAIAHDAGADLNIITPSEFQDERYLENTIDRCFYCKSNLFEEIRRNFPEAIVLTGANRDDLDDFRPGLKAAADFNVRHPFIEAGYGKNEIRLLARILGLSELASAPSSPCLSSRIFTGTRISSVVLGKSEEVEELLTAAIGIGNHRCRFGTGRVVLEIDPVKRNLINDEFKDELKNSVGELFGLTPHDILVGTYQRGNGYV